jgi:hypothetical protein
LPKKATCRGEEAAKLNEEVLGEIKVVRREMEGKRGR